MYVVFQPWIHRGLGCSSKPTNGRLVLSSTTLLSSSISEAMKPWILATLLSSAYSVSPSEVHVAVDHAFGPSAEVRCPCLPSTPTSVVPLVYPAKGFTAQLNPASLTESDSRATRRRMLLNSFPLGAPCFWRWIRPEIPRQ